MSRSIVCAGRDSRAGVAAYLRGPCDAKRQVRAFAIPNEQFIKTAPRRRRARRRPRSEPVFPKRRTQQQRPNLVRGALRRCVRIARNHNADTTRVRVPPVRAGLPGVGRPRCKGGLALDSDRARVGRSCSREIRGWCRTLHWSPTETVRRCSTLLAFKERSVKRTFLVPVTAAVAALAPQGLLAPTPIGASPAAERTVVPADVEPSAKRMSRALLALAPGRATPGRMAAHASHSSHASHASHASHSSHFSGSPGSSSDGGGSGGGGAVGGAAVVAGAGGLIWWSKRRKGK